MVNEYWEQTQYYPTCNVCNQKYNPHTRWCSKDCWIRQRKKPTFEEYVDETMFGGHGGPQNDNKKYDMEHWNILKLIPPKTQKEIKKQYYKLALLYHPDKPNGDKDLFTQLNNSYNTLILSY
jgi:hypothetical protein